MQIKTFTAPTASEAIAIARTALGADALVIASEATSDGTVRVTAAVEPENGRPVRVDVRDDVADIVLDALAFHATPAALSERLAKAAVAMDAEDPTLAFAGAVDGGFRFQPLAGRTGGERLMLVGPPGVGKTVTAAKLAARANLNGLRVGVITTDTRRAGGVEQLEAFTRILEIDLVTADTARDLAAAVGRAAANDCIYIDSAGTNPFNGEEMADLSERIEASGAEPVLVLAAGGDSSEAAEIAEAFAGLGTRRLIATRIDVARRLGGLLSAADAGGLTFSEVSITPHVADGLTPLNPLSLARLLMPAAEPDGPASVSTEEHP